MENFILVECGISTGPLKTHPNFVSIATRELFSKAFTFPITNDSRSLNRSIKVFRSQCRLYRQNLIQQILIGFEHDSAVAFSKANKLEVNIKLIFQKIHFRCQLVEGC